MNALPRVTATRFVTPLREGGSLPGIVEADDLGTYVCKFRGAGQGLPVLVAEVIVSGLAEALGLRTPRLVEVDLTEPIARYEADEEVQDLLNASLGLNLGVDFLPGSFGFDSGVEVEPTYAATVLWLDAFVANVDRSWRNPNLLVWHGDVWVIDHGASLYFHHGWSSGVTDPSRFAEQPWSADDHVLGAHLDAVAGLDQELGDRITDAVVDEILARVPDAWLVGPVPPAELRAAYRAFLLARRDGHRSWLPRRGAA
ncbi:MAG: HipA family kinase [Marmoricola sp.]